MRDLQEYSKPKSLLPRVSSIIPNNPDSEGSVTLPNIAIDCRLQNDQWVTGSSKQIVLLFLYHAAYGRYLGFSYFRRSTIRSLKQSAAFKLIPKYSVESSLSNLSPNHGCNQAITDDCVMQSRICSRAHIHVALPPQYELLS